MRGQGEQIDPVADDVEAELPRALRRIDVQQHTARATYAAYLAYVLDDTGLVVDVHQRHEDRVRAQRGLDLRWLDDPVGSRAQVAHLESLAFQTAAWIEHRRMLGT